MRYYGILATAGLVVIAVGFVMILTAQDIALPGGETVVLPEGVDGYACLDVDMGSGGPITGTFESSDGSAVILRVMDEGQFDRFLESAEVDSRTTVAGTSGEFTVEQVDMEACYIVLHHDLGTAVEQTVTVDYVVTNSDFVSEMISTALVMTGSAMSFALPVYLRSRAKSKTTPKDTKYIDVTIFDE